MASFESTFVNTNIPDGAAPYSQDALDAASRQLRQADSSFFREFDLAAICVILCGNRRADAVPKYFEAYTKDLDEATTTKLFIQVREAITIIFPFIGLPNTIPALLGLTPYIKRRGLKISNKPSRPAEITATDVENGEKYFHTIYDAVGNMAVHEMLETYYPDINYALRTIVFGYLMHRANDTIFTQQENQFCIAAAITASGATRQARSHLKGGIDMGVSKEAMAAMCKIATEDIPEWSNIPCSAKGKMNVEELNEEVVQNRALLNSGKPLAA